MLEIKKIKTIMPLIELLTGQTLLRNKFELKTISEEISKTEKQRDK